MRFVLAVTNLSTHVPLKIFPLTLKSVRSPSEVCFAKNVKIPMASAVRKCTHGMFGLQRIQARRVVVGSWLQSQMSMLAILSGSSAKIYEMRTYYVKPKAFGKERSTMSLDCRTFPSCEWGKGPGEFDQSTPGLHRRRGTPLGLSINLPTREVVGFVQMILCSGRTNIIFHMLYLPELRTCIYGTCMFTQLGS